MTEISKICPRSWGSSPGGCGHCRPDCDIIIKVYRGIINYSLYHLYSVRGAFCCVITNSRCLQTNMNSNHNLMSFTEKFLKSDSSSQHLALQIFLQKFLFMDIILLFIMFLSVKRFAMNAWTIKTNEKSVYQIILVSWQSVPQFMIPFPKRTRAVFSVVVVIHEDFLINSNWFVCNLTWHWNSNSTANFCLKSKV